MKLKPKTTPASDPVALRRQAETRLKVKTATCPTRINAYPRQLQHELEVLQIELEMNNEELMASRDKLTNALERYTDLYDFAPVGYFNLSTNGSIRLVNLTGARLVGIERARLMGTQFTALLASSDRRVFGDFLARAMATKAKQKCNVGLATASGPPLIVQLEASRSSDGTECRVVMSDITQRWQAEEALHESEERFRTMANSISQLAWIARADGFFHWYNQRWYDYTGTTPEQMEGWGWQSVHDPEVLPKVMEIWKDAIETGRPFEMEFPLRGADGEFRTFLTRGLPLKNSEGRVTQWFGTNTNVETLKQAEEKVRELNLGLEQRVAERTIQLEAANQELEAFSYSVSHDLRAPLRAVNGFARIVLDKYGPLLPEDGQRYLERIRQGGHQMGQLIDDLLAFSRLSRQSLHRCALDSNQLVKSALDELELQRKGRQIELHVARLPACLGDAKLLKQVWVNLIGNAIKYTGGRAPAVIEIGCERLKGDRVFFVRDNGAGFDMRYAHKLFTVFQRLHSAEEFEGTGVGLAIVQHIVQRHGGRVWAESKEGCGAVFRFTLGKETKL